MIGGSRQSVNRLLADLVAEGLVRFDGDELSSRTRVGSHRHAAMSREGDTVEAVPAAVGRRVAAADRLAPRHDDSLLTAVATAATALEAQAASIALYDAATDRLVFRAASGLAAGGIVGMAIDPEVGIAGYVFTTGQPLAVADVAADPRFERSVAEATGSRPVDVAGRAAER